MQSSSSVKWFPLKLKNPVELKLDVTLQCGQSFRWRQTKLDNQSVWVGPIGSTVFGLKEQDDDLYFTTFPLTESSLNEELLKKYFMLDLSLSKLKEEWSTADPNFKKLASTGRFDGLRLLQLDPVECLFCFICSQNNNIKRITKMVESLCTKYGKVLQTVNDIPIYQFPTVQDLATNADEDTLRALGFGYRARYIVTAAQQIIEKDNGKPGSWLASLPEKSRAEVQTELVSLMGIGKKVADCIALFSMNKLDVIPVDTHVWQIAQTYMPSLRKKKLNDTVYVEIGDFFRKLFGPYTGWAHTLLFAAELSFFKDTAPVVVEKVIETPPKAISSRRKKNVKKEEVQEEEEEEEKETPVKQVKRSRKNKS